MADLAVLKDPHVSPVLVEGDPSLHKVTNDVSADRRRHQSKSSDPVVHGSWPSPAASR